VHRVLINDIIKEKEEISMAATLLREISKDEHERARLRSRRMYETDLISDLLTAEEKGEIRGIAKGQEKKAVEIARKMKIAGRPLKEIKEFTDLSFETIESL
jgi:predicted transposase/invertase (TIGR01784 family)